MDAEQFQARFIAWTQTLCALTQGQQVSVDGKKLRRSHDRPHGRDGLWLVSAWVSDNRMVLGQYKVDATSNEITAIPELLALLDLTGCVVTVDAIGSQTEIAQQIVSARADYILPVKENQGTLYEDQSRIRKDHAPQKMAVLRHMAINLLKREQSARASDRHLCGHRLLSGAS